MVRMVAATEEASEDKNYFEKNKNAALIKDELWYLISNQWYYKWLRYAKISKDADDLTDEEETSPGKIDNTLILENGSFKVDALESDDFQLVHREVFLFLREKYGLVSDKHEIPRKVIELKGNRGERMMIELVPYQLTFRIPQRAGAKAFNAEFSKSQTGSDVYNRVRELLSEALKLDKKFRLHMEISKGEFEKLEHESVLNDVCTNHHMNVEIEFADLDGRWTRDNKSKRENGATGGLPASSSYSQSASSCNYYPKPRSFVSHPGLRGLNNLGNTCFMNSAIQCLSNVPSLTNYFRKSDWRKEINRDNPLGMNGEIALSYADLIDNLWCEGGASTFMPRRFKMAVGKFAPQFSGFQQQDAQELMAFLLDGLHEDLNRIKKKPYVEVKDYDESRSDEEVALESWENYRKRNHSVIVDLFHGQLRSELHCPECNRLSVTFDPFCYLSLPLPHEELPVSVTLVRATHVMTKFAMRVSADVSYRELINCFRDIARLPDSTPIIFSDCNASSASLRCLPPSYLVDEYGTTPLLDHSFRSYNFYAFELAEVPQDLHSLLLFRIDFSSDAQPCLKPRPWMVALEKTELNKQDPDGRKRLVYDALLRDSAFVNFFPTLRQLVNNSSTELLADESDGEDGQKSDELMQVDNDAYNELDRLFSLEFQRHYSLKYLEMAEAKLNVEVPAAFFLCQDDESVANSKNHWRGVGLHNCLDMFTKKEKLGDRDLWYCKKCKKHQRATKKFDLWKLPDTLVIHIKRFGNANRLWRNKLNTKVFFPLGNLDMRPWVKNCREDYKYDLVSVTNHYGSMGGGHYTAFGRNNDDDGWYNFDDSSVTSTSPDSVVTQNAYVLVYCRQRPSSGSQNNAMDSQYSGMMDTE